MRRRRVRYTRQSNGLGEVELEFLVCWRMGDLAWRDRWQRTDGNAVLLRLLCEWRDLCRLSRWARRIVERCSFEEVWMVQALVTSEPLVWIILQKIRYALYQLDRNRTIKQ